MAVDLLGKLAPRTLPRVGKTVQSLFGPLAVLRGELGDQAIAAAYWTQFGVQSSGGVVDQWDDARGAGYGPSLLATLTARPTWTPATGLIGFDGVNDVLEGTGGGLTGAGFTAHSLVIIGTLPLATTGTTLGETSLAGAASGIRLRWNSTPSVESVTSAVAALFPAPGTGLRAIHGRARQNAANIDTGCVTGSGVEVTASAIGTAVAVSRLTLGCTRAAALFGAYSVMAALVIRDGTGASRPAINRFAAALGASL